MLAVLTKAAARHESVPKQPQPPGAPERSDDANDNRIPNTQRNGSDRVHLGRAKSTSQQHHQNMQIQLHKQNLLKQKYQN